MSAEDNFLVSALTSTHPAAGAEARRGAGRGGEGCGASGRRVGVPRALTSSAIFQTFDPFRKARRSPAATAVPPRPPRGSAPAQASEGRGGPPAATCRAPRGHLRRRGGPLAAPPGPRRTPPAPLGRHPATRQPRSHACTPRPPLALSPSRRRRPAFPSGRCSRRHGGLCRRRRRRRRSGCFPRLTLGEVWRCRLDVRRSASLSLPPAGGARRSAAREGAGPGRALPEGAGSRRASLAEGLARALARPALAEALFPRPAPRCCGQLRPRCLAVRPNRCQPPPSASVSTLADNGELGAWKPLKPSRGLRVHTGIQSPTPPDRRCSRGPLCWGKVAGEVTEQQFPLPEREGSFSFFKWPFFRFDKYFSLWCVQQGELSKLPCQTQFTNGWLQSMLMACA